METIVKTGKSGTMEIGLQGITLEVDENKLSAHLVFPQEGERKDLDPSELIQTLQEDFGIQNISRWVIDDAVTHWNDGATCDERILIAEGTPPINGKDGTAKWTEDYFGQVESDDDSTRVDFFNQSKISVVNEGVTVAKITHPTKGLDGVDIYGNEILAKGGQPPPVEVGDNLEIEEDGSSVVTKTQGQIILSEGKVSIKEILEIDGNVDYDVGKIDFPGTIIVKGNILDGFSVKAAGELYVNGLVEAATLESGADMFLKGGVSGKNKGKITCGGKLTTKHLDNIDVEVEEEIEISNEIVNCSVISKSRIILPRGSIIGGEVSATKGIEVGVLGSDGKVRTKITIGRDFEVEAEIVALNKEIKSTEEKMNKLDKRLQVGKHKISKLPKGKEDDPNIKEALTKLNFCLEELKAELERIKEKKSKLWGKLKTTREEATLLVKRVIHQGVIIDIGGERKEWEKDYTRPVKLRYNTANHKIDLLGIK